MLGPATQGLRRMLTSVLGSMVTQDDRETIRGWLNEVYQLRNDVVHRGHQHIEFEDASRAVEATGKLASLLEKIGSIQCGRGE